MKQKLTPPAALLFSALLAIPNPAFADLYQPPADHEISFESFASRQSFINNETGALIVTQIKPEAWSSRWHIEPVGEGDYIRIKSKWTGCYLNVENGPIVCGAKDAGWWSAQWHVSGADKGGYQITNRWTNCRLRRADVMLACTPDASVNSQELWLPIDWTHLQAKLKEESDRINGAFKAQREQQEALAEWQWSQTPRGKKVVQECCATFLSTDGPYPDKFGVGFPGLEISNLNDDFDEDIEVIEILLSEVTVIAFEHPNFQGRRIELGCGVWELIGDPENEISSIKVIVQGNHLFNPNPSFHDCLKKDHREIRNWNN
jgi:hypothetical protein